MKAKLRRTMLYAPGNSAGMVKDAHIYGSDSVMFDLEDSISLDEKDSARFLVFNALRTLSYEGIETVVRVNGLDTPFGEQDVRAMVKAKPDIIRLPKAETPQDIKDMEALIEREEIKNGYPIGTISMMAAIESPLGVFNALAIASASPRLVGLALGAEDYVTCMKTNRSPEGTELLFARSTIVNAARAVGIDALDTVYSDLDNEEGLIKEALHIKQLGFDGKSIISPRQIDPIHKVFTPTLPEVEKALRIQEAIHKAQEKGLGVISLNGKMVDKPIVDRASRVLMLAKMSGIYGEEIFDEQ